MRGCLSYEIVSLMKRGASPVEACGEALRSLSGRKIELGEDTGSISVIALNPRGETGAATTLELFPYASGGEDGCALYAVGREAPAPRPVGEEEMKRLGD